MDDGCDAFSSGVAEATKRCASSGRGTIGWLLRDTGRQARKAWLDLRTGEGRLRALPGREG
jgi:hypothetical protein